MSVFGALANHVQLALERVLIHLRAALDENLLDVRLAAARHAPDGVAVERRVAPAQNREAFFLRNPLDDAFAQNPLVRIHRQEHHAHAVFAGRWQGNAKRLAFALEKRVRNLDQDARAVAGLRIAAAGAAVRQIDQNLNAL